MSRARCLSHVATIGLITGLLLTAFLPSAHAGLGDPLSTATIDPVGISVSSNPQCLVSGVPGPATAIALVQGSKVNPSDPTIPVVVVTSCHTVNPTMLHFLVPTPDASVIARERSTLTTFDSVTLQPVPAVPAVAGWGAFSTRGDKGDLLACANRNNNTASPDFDRHAIYTIAYNVLQGTPAPGTATKLFTVPSNGVAVCDGLAWDHSTDTVYKTDKTVVAGSVSITSIKHYDVAGNVLLPDLPVPANCGDGTLTLAGGGLLLSCSGDLSIHHLDKTTGVEKVSPPPTLPLGQPQVSFEGVETPFLTAAVQNGVPPSDVECDAVTFASGVNAGLHKDALWTRQPGDVGPQLAAFELPGGTCGFHKGSLANGTLVLAPGACLLKDANGVFVRDVTGKPIQNLADVGDDDGDSVLNCWEDGQIYAVNEPCPGCTKDGKPGIDFDGDGVRDLIVCDNNNPANSGNCSDRMHRDVWAELDYLTNHLPDATARTNVINAFAAAPGGGISLHYQLGEVLTETVPPQRIALEPCTGPAGAGDIDVRKLLYGPDQKFGTPAERAAGEKTIAAKRLAFHYGVFAHNLVGATNSGCAQIGGAVFVVSLGSFASTLVGGVTHNRGTLEQQQGALMHEQGHNHGFRHGGDDNNNCKPNYLSVMSYSRWSAALFPRRLDYSRNQLPDLDENNGPSEAAGLGGGASPPLPANEQTAFGYVGSKNVNNYKVVPLPAASIDWNQKSGQTASNVNRIDAIGCDGIPNPTVLHGFNDWANFHFNLRASLEFAGGGDTEQEEVTSEDEQLAFWSLDSDSNEKGDGLDCSNNPDPGNTNFYCVGDAKPGDALNKVNLSTNPGSTGSGGALLGTLPFALLGSANFNPGTKVNRLSLTIRGEAELVGHPVDKKGNGDANCTTGDLSGPALDPVGVPVGIISVPDGFTDLICKFSGLRFDGPGSYYVILEGQLTDGRKIRARDVVNVQ